MHSFRLNEGGNLKLPLEDNIPFTEDEDPRYDSPLNGPLIECEGLNEGVLGNNEISKQQVGQGIQALDSPSENEQKIMNKFRDIDWAEAANKELNA